jgi:hypothetical protein
VVAITGSGGCYCRSGYRNGSDGNYSLRARYAEPEEPIALLVPGAIRLGVRDSFVAVAAPARCIEEAD